KQAGNPVLSNGFERIILAAVADPSPLVVRVLERLAGKIPTLVLIHAPQPLADCFDQWGRPLISRWQERGIEIPDADANVILSSSPREQSHKVLELMAGEASRLGPADVAIGVPDTEVTAYLASDLKEQGLTPFDPAGKRMACHPLYQLLDGFRSLVNEGTYQALSAFLRSADLLEFLGGKHHLQPRRLLEELDRFQNSRLPQVLGDIAGPLAAPPASVGRNGGFPSLTEAVDVIMKQVMRFESTDLDSTLRSLLQTVYEWRTVNPAKGEDAEFIAVAQSIDTALHQLASGSLAPIDMSRNNALELLLWDLSSQQYYPEPASVVIDLEGWLELPWNDAPFLIVTGMNEGSVPSSQISDVFLPDTLRRQLKLRSNTDWFARDAYLMSALVESRRGQGRVCFIAGKTSSTGDVLKP
ncbi:MAG: hypothetical protein NTU41_01790, partial [Chloroflexi bacterium]|nr:hypothetical protein [Chloroflexota bacterium]